MSKQIWKEISDENIRHVWLDTDTNEEVFIYPYFYEESGTPVCHESGNDMEYLRTEVLVTDAYSVENA